MIPRGLVVVYQYGYMTSSPWRSDLCSYIDCLWTGWSRNISLSDHIRCLL